MLRGSAQLYLDVILEPQLVKDLLEISLINLKAYCKAAIEAGADVICTSNPVANMDCISRKHFEEFSHPYTMELFKACKEYGAKATMYHTCGLWTDRFDLLCQENIDMFHVNKVDIPEFKKQYSDYVVTMGNVRTVVSLLQGTPEHVFEETKRCLEEGKPGGRYVINGDCAVPRDTPHENVLAMAEAVQKYAAY